MVATQTITTVTQTHTQASLVTLIKNGFTAAGFSVPVVDTTVGTDRVIVYQIVSDAAKTYGTAFLRIRITTTLTILQTLSAGFNTTTNVPVNPGTESSAFTAVTNLSIEVRTYVKANEFRFVILSQGTGYGVFGYLRPEERHPCFDENVAPYIFQSANVFNTNTYFNTWQCTGLSPYMSGGTPVTAFFTHMTFSSLAIANPVTNQRDSIAGMLLYPSSGQGIAAKTSNEIIMIAASGLTRFDSIQVTPGVEEYILLFPGAGSMALRTV